MPQPIFHIAERQAWEDSLARGRYEAPSLASEGFIHCSTRDQVVDTAQRHFRGRSELCLFALDPVQLGAALKYERNAHGLFPHVYGPITHAALLRVLPFEPGGPDLREPCGDDMDFRLPALGEGLSNNAKAAGYKVVNK